MADVPGFISSFTSLTKSSPITTEAEMAVPALRRAAEGKDPQVAFACRWALDRFAFRGTLLTDFQDCTVVLLDEQGVEQRRIAPQADDFVTDLIGPSHVVVPNCPQVPRFRHCRSSTSDPGGAPRRTRRRRHLAP